MQLISKIKIQLSFNMMCNITPMDAPVLQQGRGGGGKGYVAPCAFDLKTS